MTDPGMADRTYVGPMTPELVEQILAKVGKAALHRHVGVHAAALVTLVPHHCYAGAARRYPANYGRSDWPEPGQDPVRGKSSVFVRAAVPLCRRCAMGCP